MEEVINNHLQRMKKLQSIYEEGTGQHNILGILINELTEQLRQYNVVGQSEQLICDTCKNGLIDYPEINRRTCRCGRLGYNVTD